MTHVDTGFLATKHGFPFPNSYPPGSPVIEWPTPFGRIRIGDASGGLCGGMVFSALDLFLFNSARPKEPVQPVYRYLCRRLLDSWNFPFGVLKYFDWQCRPGSCRGMGGVKVQDGVTRLTIEEEWPKIRASLDCGMPVPLGLVQAHSFHPRHLSMNHQVLATGYRLDGETLTIPIYDPNYPDDDGLSLTIELRDPEKEQPADHSITGKTVRGFFFTEYTRPLLVPVFEE